MTRYQIALILTLVIIVLIVSGVIFLIKHIIKKTIDYKCKKEYEYQKFANAEKELDEIKIDIEKHQ